MAGGFIHCPNQEHAIHIDAATTYLVNLPAGRRRIVISVDQNGARRVQFLENRLDASEDRSPWYKTLDDPFSTLSLMYVSLLEDMIVTPTTRVI